jgi:hypothetical protein
LNDMWQVRGTVKERIGLILGACLRIWALG